MTHELYTREQQRIDFLGSGQPDHVKEDLAAAYRILEGVEHSGFDDIILCRGVVRMTWIWSTRWGEIDIQTPWAICWSCNRTDLGAELRATFQTTDIKGIRLWLCRERQPYLTKPPAWKWPEYRPPNPRLTA